MLQLLIDHQTLSICVLFIWMIGLNTIFCIAINDDTPPISASFLSMIECGILWIFLYVLDLQRLEYLEATVLSFNILVTLCITGLVPFLYVCLVGGFICCKNYCQQKKAKIDIVVNAKRICKKGKITVGERMELKKVLSEYETLNHEISSLGKKLKLYSKALSKVQTLHLRALQQGKDETDEELKASYFNTVEELAKELNEMQSLVDSVQKQADEKKTRLVEILKLFKQAKEKAQAYREYDTFTSQTLKTQKEVKEALLVANKVK